MTSSANVTWPYPDEHAAGEPDSGKLDALAEATMKLFEDDTLRRAYGERSLAAAALHTRERQAQRMIGVLELAAQGRGGEVAALHPA